MTSSIILLLCLNLQTPEYKEYYSSCIYALQAASIQYNISSKIERIKNEIEENFRKRTNDTTKALLGITYGFFQKGSILIHSDFKPISDTITIETGTSKSNLTFTWTF